MVRSKNIGAICPVRFIMSEINHEKSVIFGLPTIYDESGGEARNIYCYTVLQEYKGNMHVTPKRDMHVPIIDH